MAGTASGKNAALNRTGLLLLLAFRQNSRASFNSGLQFAWHMVDDTDIWRAAKLMIDRHGADAAAAAGCSPRK